MSAQAEQLQEYQYRFWTVFLFRGILAILIYTWTKTSTPLHALMPSHGPFLYDNLMQIIIISSVGYLGIYTLAFGLRYFPRVIAENDNYKMAVLEVAALMLLLLDLFVIFYLQSTTGGARSPFYFMNFIMIALCTLMVRSVWVNLLYLAMTAGFILIIFTQYDQPKSTWDIMFKDSCIIIFHVLLLVIRGRRPLI